MRLKVLKNKTIANVNIKLFPIDTTRKISIMGKNTQSLNKRVKMLTMPNKL